MLTLKGPRHYQFSSKVTTYFTLEDWTDNWLLHYQQFGVTITGRIALSCVSTSTPEWLLKFELVRGTSELQPSLRRETRRHCT